MITIHDGEYTHFIEPEAIGSWGELLDLDYEEEIISAIIHVAKNGEPEPDPATGENVWTETYRNLSEREESRVREIQKALSEGTAEDPRSPELRGAFAVFSVRPVVQAAQNELKAALGINLAPQIPTPELDINLVDLKNSFRENITREILNAN